MPDDAPRPRKMRCAPVSASTDDGSSTVTDARRCMAAGRSRHQRRESIAELRRRDRRAAERVARARLSDSRADPGGEREEERCGGEEHEQRRQERVAERPVDDRAPAHGGDIALERGARDRSVERGDERVSKLGDALLEPEGDNGERAHASAAIEGVGGSGERERDGDGERAGAKRARDAEEIVEDTDDREKRRRRASAQRSARATTAAPSVRRVADASGGGCAGTWRAHADARWRRSSGSSSRSPNAATRSQVANFPDDVALVSSERVATSGPVPRSCARAESEAGAARFEVTARLREQRDKTPRTFSQRQIARAGQRNRDIAHAAVHHLPLGRGGGAVGPARHNVAGWWIGHATKGATTTDRAAPSPAITAPAVSTCARRAVSARVERAGHRTSVSPYCVHVVSTSESSPIDANGIRFIVPRSRRTANENEALTGSSRVAAHIVELLRPISRRQARERERVSRVRPRRSNRGRRRVELATRMEKPERAPRSPRCLGARSPPASRRESRGDQPRGSGEKLSPQVPNGAGRPADVRRAVEHERDVARRDNTAGRCPRPTFGAR